MVEPPEVRIGDRDRDRAELRLQDAYSQGTLTLEEFQERLEAALGARTRGQLEPLLADLPATPDPGGITPARAAEPSRPNWTRRVGLLAVVAGLVFGVGTVVRGTDSVTLFGSTVYNAPVDLADESVDEIRVLSLFGSVEVVVPEGAVTENGVTSVMGSSQCELVCGPSAGGGPDLRVDGWSVFGSVEIRGG